jgi:hypothetical protein
VLEAAISPWSYPRCSKGWVARLINRQRAGQLAKCEEPQVRMFTGGSRARRLPGAAERRCATDRAPGHLQRKMTTSGVVRELEKTGGFIKVIIDADLGAILGATALCEQGSKIKRRVSQVMGRSGQSIRRDRMPDMSQTSLSPELQPVLGV